jgi:hypothetical protein
MTTVLDCTGDKNYVYTQSTPTTLINLSHALNKYPSVEVLDTGGNVVYPNIQYISIGMIQITFVLPFTGTVVLN